MNRFKLSAFNFMRDRVGPGSLGRIVFRSSLCILAVLWFGCRAPAKDSSNAAVPVADLTPVILVTSDALRADALSCYNPETPPTPNLDSFAGAGVMFKNARSTAPWTVPSIASIMTAVSPAASIMTRTAKLPLQLDTMAERLKGVGYHTAAVGLSIWLIPEYRFDQGFDHYDFYPQTHLDKWTSPSSAELADKALEVIRQNKNGNLFLWLHIFDPHDPYGPPAPFLPAGTAPPGIGIVFNPNEDDPAAAAFVPNEAEKEWIRQLYLGEVRYMDQQFGRVVAALRESGLYDRSLVIFTSDHGEEFWERGKHGHGHALTPEQIHVPLLIKPPGMGTGTVVDSEVGTLGLLPTVMDLLGIPCNTEALSAESFAGLVRGDPSPPSVEPVFSMSTIRVDPMISVQSAGQKCVLNLKTRETSFFDLAADPGEMTPLPAPPNESAARLPLWLDEFFQREQQLRSLYAIESPDLLAPNPRMISELQSLGYL